MLRVAVPNKGVLSEVSVDMLREAGYLTRRDTRELVLFDPHNDIEFFYLRPRDIATYVGRGALDVGITGRDLLLDSHSDANEVAVLEFGDSTFRFAGPVGKFTDLSQIQGLRVATSYVGLVQDFLTANDIDATLIQLDGAVESAIKLGVADVIADVVSTGTTLRNAGLEIFGPVILESTAILIGSPESAPDGTLRDKALKLSRRLHGVRVARQYVLFDYDVPAEHLDRAAAITPGLESPTISQLADTGWFAVRAMVRRDQSNDTMDALYEVGARAILVSSIAAARI